MSENKQIIIGITGTLGAGKGTIVDYLVKTWAFKHFSVRDFLIKEIEKLGLIVNRDSMVEVANNLRANNSPSYITDQLFAEATKSGFNSIIESIRTPGEIDSLRKNPGFKLIAVTADPLKRYQRIILRNSQTDQVGFETFKANEKREMESDDPNKQNLQKCISEADILFTNDGTIEDLQKQVKNYIVTLNI